MPATPAPPAHDAADAPDAAVVLACDAAYAPYALCLAERIAALHPRGGFDLWVLSEAPLAPPPGLGVPRLRTLAVPENPFRDALPASRHGAATFLKLLAPDLLGGRYRRLLYLDADIWAERGGIDRLLRSDLGGAALAAVRDNTQWRTPGRRAPEFRALGRPARPYLNAGVLLIDPAAWRAGDVLGRCLALVRERPDALARHDQSLINLALDGAWAELSPVWNWQHTRSSRHFGDLAGARLVHFIGPGKPWLDAGRELPARIRRPYAGFLARHYPAFPAPPAEGRARPRRLRRSLLRHWWAAPAMERYLGRFADDWTLLPPPHSAPPHSAQ